MTLNNNEAYVITETALTTSPEIIEDNGKTIKFVAELQEAEAPNRNGRIYSREAIENALNHYSVQEKIRNKAFYGR